jgi:hypothetical protein
VSHDEVAVVQHRMTDEAVDKGDHLLAEFGRLTFELFE